ncbi:unnamed protein product, partial [marine sediment metagenome]
MKTKIKRAGVFSIISAVVVAVMVFASLSSAALALSFTTDNVSMTSDDGQIASVTVAPYIRMDWENLDETPNNAI